MKNILKSMKFDIEFKFTRMQKDRQCDIQCQPLETLLKVCDGKAKESLEKSYLNERETNIKFVGLASLEIKGRMVTNSVKEAMRIEDAKMSLKSYIEDKFQHNHHVIDFEVRNAFKCKEVTVPVLKCAYGCNYYGIRNALINDDLIEKECLRCNAIETWDHIVRCPKVRSKQREFIINLRE